MEVDGANGAAIQARVEKLPWVFHMRASRGVHPKVVSETLGHADIAITLRVYAHVTRHMQQAAADVMDRTYGTQYA